MTRMVAGVAPQLVCLAAVKESLTLRLRHWPEQQNDTCADSRSPRSRACKGGKLGAPESRSNRASRTGTPCSSYDTTSTVSGEERDRATGVVAIAILTVDRCIRLAHRAKSIEFDIAFQANILINRHAYPRCYFSYIQFYRRRS